MVPSTSPPRIARFGDLEAEYQALGDGCALLDRSRRVLLEITGADRASWLHNLTSNHVKSLSSGDGNYAFCLNAQGRILFDLDILVDGGSIWIDLDESFRSWATAHFAKYKIMEDVAVVDRASEFVRIGIAGKLAPSILGRLGASHAANTAILGSVSIPWDDLTIRAIRTDFCGSLGFEFFVPANLAVAWWQCLKGLEGVLPAGDDAVDIRRIEAGLPWPGREITEECLPAETGQFERAVSSNKGCYIGQEIVERMRSRHAVARRLAGLEFEGSVAPFARAILKDGAGAAVGTVTSVCRSLLRGTIIGLGYVRTDASRTGSILGAEWEGGAARATVRELPFSAR